MSVRGRTLTLLTLLAAGVAQPIQAQADTERLLQVHRLLARISSDAIWPGFRPDTIPVLYVLPERGTLLAGWPGSLPPGFEAIPQSPRAAWRGEAARGAASTAVDLGGRPVAQVVVDSRVSDAELLALTVHEAFHVFQAASRREGRRFGSGENSFLVTTYPIFDRENETGVALEGRLLQAALAAPSDSAARGLAQRFVAAREARHRSLASDLATFEALAELNEGLAEYAGLRALVVSELPLAWTTEVARLTAGLPARVGQLTEDLSRSLRLRYYATGPAMAFLLDRLTGPEWKRELVDSNRTLQDQLAHALGAREGERHLVADARGRFDWDGLVAHAERTIASLRSLRQAQVDSVLAAPGVLLVIDGSAIGGGIGMCGIDPQNLLQVGAGVLLHTRWVRPCAGRALQGEFNTRTVFDQPASTLQAVIGTEGEVRVTAEGEPLSLADGESRTVTALEVSAPGAMFRSDRAEVRRNGRVLSMRLLPP